VFPSNQHPRTNLAIEDLASRLRANVTPTRSDRRVCRESGPLFGRRVKFVLKSTHSSLTQWGLRFAVIVLIVLCVATYQVRMPRRPQKTGGLLQGRRGYLTHAGLAAMAEAARLGPA
jgi:hypothetical protein